VGAAEAVKSRCDYKNNLSPATTSRLSGTEADSVCDFVPNLPFNSRVVVYPEVIQSVTCGSIPRRSASRQSRHLPRSAFLGTNAGRSLFAEHQIDAAQEPAIHPQGLRVK